MKLPLLRETIRHLILESKPKFVPTNPPPFDRSIKKAWTVMVTGERIGEIAKIDMMVRDGRHYTDGSARVRGWQAYTGNRPFAKRSMFESFRTKKEALDWLLRQ